MKKRIALLVVAMILANTVNCFASYADLNWEDVIQKVESGEYGGIYVDSNVNNTNTLHIKPVSEENKIKIEQIVSDFAPNSNIVIDDIAKYSMAQLEQGQQKTDSIWQELQLNFVAIEESKNGLSVGSLLEWTEERKALFINTTDIENVEFITVKKGYDIDDSGTISQLDREKRTFRVSTEYNGTLFTPNKNGGKEGEKTIAVYQKNDHMMIAVKDIATFRGTDNNLSAAWDNENKTVTLKLWRSEIQNVVFTKDSNKMIVNGVEVEMEEAAEIKDNRFYIPITALFEVLQIPQQDIEWIEQGKNVRVTY